jgi:chromosome segregation ATPase
LCDEATVDELAARLGDLCGLEFGAGALDRMRTAEAELQHIVTGRDRDQIAADLAWLGGQSRASSDVAAALPFRSLRQRVDSLSQRLHELEQQSRDREHELNHSLGEMRESAARLRGDLAVANEHLAGTLRELEAHRSELDSARTELAMWRAWRQSFDRKLSVRAYQALRRLLGR